MALYDLKNPYDEIKFDEACKAAKAAKDWVELKKKHTQRSLSQNSYLHVLLGYFASEFGYSKEEVKFRFFKLHCNRDIFETERINKRGQKVTHIRNSSELDKAEMTLAIERFRNYSSSECGLYLPEPRENDMIIFIQQQLEMYKEFL